MAIKQPAIYILTNKYNGTLYTGVTSNLIQRIYQHKEFEIPGFTQRYKLKTLVYYEIFDNMESAITREKKLKVFARRKKIKLIERVNPNWIDLYSSII
jgi:putative endonuclease